MNRRDLFRNTAGAIVGGTFARLAPAAPPAPSYILGCNFGGASSTGIMILESSCDGKTWVRDSFLATTQEETEAAVARLRARLADDFAQ